MSEMYGKRLFLNEYERNENGRSSYKTNLFAFIHNLLVSSTEIVQTGVALSLEGIKLRFMQNKNKLKKIHVNV